MTTRLTVDPAAEEDILDAYSWYEARSPGLGAKFLNSLDATFEIVIENPAAFPVVVEEVRRTITRTFPYLIFYTSNGDSIHILGVIHAAQDPDFVAARLDA